MSSGNLILPRNTEALSWSAELDPADYLFATYHVSARSSGEAAALGMAMEQSVATRGLSQHVDLEALAAVTIRVCRVATRPLVTQAVGVPAYTLSTEVYLGRDTDEGHYEIELAIPRCLLLNKPAQLLNVVVGELPRLGFLTRWRLTDVRLPTAFGPGPAFGAPGILARLGQPRGPLLCRAMRPAVGLDLDTMAALNREVLIGGFHLVKDDELIVFPDLSAYRRHLERMLAARDQAMQISGEPKLYLANLICEPEELRPRWELACALGVDGVLVAPFIQGLGVLPTLARDAERPLLAHNSFSDLLTRHPVWGIADAVLARWLRHLGADWCVTPGCFTTSALPAPDNLALLEAATGAPTALPPMMPIVQGGKRPDGLPAYRAAVGHDAFMLIVAHWVDSHPAGLREAARLFREAVDERC